MIGKSRVKKLEAAHRSRRRGGGGWTIGIVGDDLPETGYVDYREAIADLAPPDVVMVGDQVLTQAQWEALGGDKILVVYEAESEVQNVKAELGT